VVACGTLGHGQALLLMVRGDPAVVSRPSACAAPHRRSVRDGCREYSTGFVGWIGHAPMSRRLSTGTTLPSPTLDTVFPWRSTWPTLPRHVATDATLFAGAWCRLCGRRTLPPSGARPRDGSLASQTSAPGT